MITFKKVAIDSKLIVARLVNSNTNINSAFDVKDYPNINSDGNTSSVDFNQRHVIIGFIMEI